MKKTIILSLLHLLIFSNSYSQSKECDCSAALSESLKDKYTDNQLLDLRIELYEYYKVIQNKSKNENVAFNLSSAARAYTSHGIFNGSSTGNGDYEKNKIQNLEKMIEKEQSISNQVFRQMATDVFSGNQLEAYKACLSSCPKQNGVFYEVSGSLDDVFAINLYFTNNLGQPKVTFATNAILVNCEPIGGFVLKKDFEIKNNTSITQYLKIIDKEKPAQIGVNFNETSFGAINLGESHGGNKSMPIGTIISSPFKYETFLEVNHFKITENMSVAIWVPCDGRNVRSSHYGKFSGNVPDLRGLFLRNVNDYNVPFDGVGKVKDNQANPENTSAGVVQEDAFKSHDHSLNNAQIHAGGAPGPDGNNYRAYGTTKTGSNGGNETRPKNMTVYYYIKIN